MVNFFNIVSDSNCVLAGVPVFSNQINVEIKYLTKPFDFIEVKCTCWLVDTEERRNIKLCYAIDSLVKLDDVLDTQPGDYLCLVVDNYANIDFIEINYNNQIIRLNKCVLEMYDKLYEKILFTYDDKTAIKIKVLFDIQQDIKINVCYLDKLERIEKIYRMKDLDNIAGKYLCVYNDGELHTYYNSWVFDINENDSNIKILLKNTHVKNIIIYYTESDGVTKLPIGDKFVIDINGIVTTYTDLDCNIYQQKYFKTNDPNINIIGFAFKPQSHWPTGEINVRESIGINYSLKFSKPDAKIHVVVFGYKTMPNILI